MSIPYILDDLFDLVVIIRVGGCVKDEYHTLPGPSTTIFHMYSRSVETVSKSGEYGHL
jgi:hypothetical protein